MIGDASNPGAADADVFWLYLIGGIVLLVVLVVAVCFNSQGHPRRWLAKMLHLNPMD